MDEPATVPVSVVIPTLGRPEKLRAALESLAACRPRAGEVLVVDQSGSRAVADLVAEFEELGARLVPCEGRGVSRGRNEGIRNAHHGIVLVTDDDCTVAVDWVATAAEAMRNTPAGIVTGRVVPVGDPRAVPSTKDDPRPFDFTGLPHGGALFPNNMALDRDAVLDFGGFDERFGPEEAAEDNEFCYRWLRSGRTIRYVPELTVSHHDWRSPKQLEDLYVAYARGQGFLYAKYLYRRDPRMLRWIARDVYWALRGLASAVVRRRPRWTDPRRGIPSGLPVGLWRGMRAYRKR
jgi:GT2 family glycosyltransferase